VRRPREGEGGRLRVGRRSEGMAPPHGRRGREGSAVRRHRIGLNERTTMQRTETHVAGPGVVVCLRATRNSDEYSSSRLGVAMWRSTLGTKDHFTFWGRDSVGLLAVHKNPVARAAFHAHRECVLGISEAAE